MKNQYDKFVPFLTLSFLILLSASSALAMTPMIRALGQAAVSSHPVHPQSRRASSTWSAAASVAEGRPSESEAVSSTSQVTAQELPSTTRGRATSTFRNDQAVDVRNSARNVGNWSSTRMLINRPTTAEAIRAEVREHLREVNRIKRREYHDYILPNHAQSIVPPSDNILYERNNDGTWERWQEKAKSYLTKSNLDGRDSKFQASARFLPQPGGAYVVFKRKTVPVAGTNKAKINTYLEFGVAGDDHPGFDGSSVFIGRSDVESWQKLHKNFEAYSTSGRDYELVIYWEHFYPAFVGFIQRNLEVFYSTRFLSIENQANYKEVTLELVERIQNKILDQHPFHGSVSTKPSPEWESPNYLSVKMDNSLVQIWPLEPEKCGDVSAATDE